MPKVISIPKNFKRFSASNKFTLLMLQGFTYGVYNTRLKLKDDCYRFRQSEIVTVLVVGELSQCKVTEFANVLGYKNAVARSVLNRAEKRKIIYREGGRKGPGHFAKYHLTSVGYKIYQTLQSELSKTFEQAKNELTSDIIRRLHMT